MPALNKISQSLATTFVRPRRSASRHPLASFERIGNVLVWHDVMQRGVQWPGHMESKYGK
jgi:hypothetical protein